MSAESKIILQSLDRLHKKVDANTATLVENTQDLKHHIKRTDVLEEQVTIVQEQNATVQTACKTLFVLLTLCSIAATIWVALPAKG